MYEAAVSGAEAAGPRTSLRELIDSGEPTIGAWCAIPSAFSAEILACAGFDWICIDMQHGLIGYGEMTAMLQALDVRGVPTFVRVQWNDPSAIMKALDAGAEGVIVPLVNSPEEALHAARASRYPPLGFRSWGPVRASLGDTTFGPETANRRVVCLVMIETPEAVEAVDEILAVPGVDGIMIGSYDLSLSTNLTVERPGDKPKDVEQITRVLQACERARVPAGIPCLTPEDVRRRQGEGFRLLQLGSDLGLLSQIATEVVRAARS
jgi:4-hydroxy-2-oxoheptanedioate aldolase